MQKIIYEWIQNLSVYMILMMAFTQLISTEEYRKYFRFFTGLLMILLILTPILRLADLETTYDELYHSIEYTEEKEAIIEYETYMEDVTKGWEATP